MVSTRSNPGWGEIVTIRGRAEWFDSAHHKRFKRTPVITQRSVRAGTQEAPMTDLTLEFSEPPSNGTPWYIVGRSPGDSDIHIDSEDGVSGCHLRLGFDEWGQIVIKDTSTFGCRLTYVPLKPDTSSTTDTVPTRVSGPTSEKDEKERHQTAWSQGDRKNPPTWVMPVGWKVIVELGDCRSPFYFEVPDHSDYLQEYRQRVTAFNAAQNNPVSFLGGLALNSQRATTRGLFSAAQRAILDGKEGRYAWIIGDKSLGEGTFGEVLEVFNTTNWCMCAGKRMKEETTFQNEAGVLKRLQHKHIVQYIDVEERRPTCPSMIIMEYYPLGDLRGQHKKKPFSESEIIHIVAQTASALKYLHEKNVTHRDLKPANILVRSRQPVEIAVTDFGISKSEESVMSTFVGTYPYMAPEVVSNNPDTSNHYQHYTNRIDIWSLGMVAVEMMIGGLPKTVSKLNDQSYASNVYKTRDKLLARFKNRDFAALVSEMLEWSHYDRPSAADCLKRASALVPVVQGAASNRSGESSRRPGKNPAEGVSSGSAATTVRVMKRVGSDMSPAKPPTKRPVATAPSKNPSVAAPSTRRDPSRELESMLRRELEDELAQSSKSGGRSAGGSAGRVSTPGASTWNRIGTAPPTKSSGSGSAGGVSTPGASTWNRIGTAPPTKSSGSGSAGGVSTPGASTWNRIGTAPPTKSSGSGSAGGVSTPGASTWNRIGTAPPTKVSGSGSAGGVSTPGASNKLGTAPFTKSSASSRAK